MQCLFDMWWLGTVRCILDQSQDGASPRRYMVRYESGKESVVQYPSEDTHFKMSAADASSKTVSSQERMRETSPASFAATLTHVGTK